MFFSLDLYRRLVLIELRSQMQYPGSFLLESFSTLISNGAGFLTFALVIDRFDNLAGWRLAEIALLYGLVDFSFGLMDMIFSGFDPDYFSQYIRRGTFDQFLLRPLSLTLQVMGSRFVLRRVGRMAEGLLILGYAVINLSIHWTIVKVLYIPAIMIGLVLYFGGLFIIGSTITFWTGESIEAINILTYGGTEMMSYPMQIYPTWMRYIFTFILPALFLNYYPALYILEKPDPYNMPEFVNFVSPFVGLFVFLIALMFWRYGIKHYESTGS